MNAKEKSFFNCMMQNVAAGVVWKQKPRRARAFKIRFVETKLNVHRNDVCLNNAFMVSYSINIFTVALFFSTFVRSFFLFLFTLSILLETDWKKDRQPDESFHLELRLRRFQLHRKVLIHFRFLFVVFIWLMDGLVGVNDANEVASILSF